MDGTGWGMGKGIRQDTGWDKETDMENCGNLGTKLALSHTEPIQDLTQRPKRLQLQYTLPSPLT